MKHQMCVRCGKRPAVVFVQKMEGDEVTPEGYCIQCAKELNIGPIRQMIDKLGLSDEDLETASEQMSQFMENMQDFDFGDLGEMFNPDNADGAQTMPFADMFGGMMGANDDSDTEEKDSKGKKGRGKKRSKRSQDDSRKFLNSYCTNLTKKAKDGKIDKIIGRETEIDRTVQILCRRTKNNPCLIGEPGVGKTAIAEGLAIKIAKGEVPARLADKEIYLLDLTALVAGTQFRGQFEGRIKGLVDEVKHEGNIILFIDEVHNLVGTGDSEGTMNAANILKPALSRGEIQVIGATTFNEYRKYIEKDAALERRFQPVKIEEPSIDDAYRMLLGIKGYYEDYHKVQISDSLVYKAVTMSERFITDRYLPDKAIDLIDEAASKKRLGSQTEPDDLKEKEKKLEKLQSEKQEAITAQDFEKAAKIRDEEKVLKEEVEKLKSSWKGTGSSSGLVVDEDDIADILADWTHIPAARLKEEEMERLKNLENILHARVIGQDEAVKALASAIRRSRVQISPRRRPASFIFVGPTGVGKTELVKVLSKELFDTPETLIRLDMSEFMEKHSVSKIIGSPPGYVGYDEAGQVTEKVRRRPYSVLLFDEIEKAHPDVLNILLQILDEGRVTDAHGRTVNFENTVIIMTSNAGSASKDSALGFGKTEEDASKEKVMKALSEFLRPEFIARVDEVIVFNSLKKDDFVKIADLMLSEYVPTLEEKHIKFTFDEKVCQLLAEKSCNGASGARDLRNTIRREVEEKIANAMIEAGAGGVTAMHLTAENGEPVLQSI